MDCLFSSLNQNGLMMLCFKMVTHAVHFVECDGHCRAVPQKMLFLLFTGDEQWFQLSNFLSHKGHSNAETKGCLSLSMGKY